MQVSFLKKPVSGWQFWIDRGGTFTDVIAISPGGHITTAKLLSEAPNQYADAAIAGIDRLLSAGSAAGQRIDAVRIGTTVGTNALLERRGARTLLLTSAGLADALQIGTQQRPELFALDVRVPPMIYEAVIETSERVGADGRVLSALDEAALERALRAERKRGMASVAIAFLHGYKFPAHEQQAAAIAARAGFTEISVSHEISARPKLIERGRTTVVDAYLSPVVQAYAADFATRLGERQAGIAPMFMQSNGGLVDARGFRGHNCILSGPAGGVVGMADSATRAGYPQIIGFDMGGTSTDVSLFAGTFERDASTEVAGTTIAVPTLRLHTVAAGGGSVLEFRDGRLQVGPDSAGASPGPACYGAGGPATLTDANVYLGRIQADYFPSVFGPGGDEPISFAAAAAAIDALAGKLAPEQSLEPAALAAGCIDIAVSHMAAAIERISVQRGHDPREFALACFGGAGGQHACLVAEALGIDAVLIDPLAGVLSAYGIGIADIRSIDVQAIECTLDANAATTATALAEELIRARVAQRHEIRLLLRAGTSDSVIAVDFTPGATHPEIAADFVRAYRERFGFSPHTAEIFVDAVEVESTQALPRPAQPLPGPQTDAAQPAGIRRAWVGGRWRDVPIFERDRLGSGARIAGPAIIAERNATTVLEPHWTACVNPDGVLILTGDESRRATSRETTTAAGEVPCDPVLLEIFNRQFTHVAEQMGAILEQTAESVNIRERLDYSCAVFDASGALIANAPHVPVHLGSMSDSVRAVLEAFPDMAPGDAFIMNAPYSGGTHLPDITVVTPMYVGQEERPGYIVASRAHHADIGGITPGSMPAHSTSIHEEGILLEPMRIVTGGRLLEAEIRLSLAGGPFPARNPDRNIADLRAQLAANGRGIRELARLLDRHGANRVRAYTGFVQRNAEECVRNAISRLRDGRCVVTLDGGERIEVAVRIDHGNRSAVIDFSGTSGQSGGNYNAPASIARAVVLYVFRTLIDHDIPLNAGCMVPLTVLLPPASLVDPRAPAAVVAGNVETSQCIADALLAAVGALAASQGTMNNFTFGNAQLQYYETICGGCGAGPGFAGASAVHSHMTNSRLTDPEILEQRYPIRVRRFLIRRGSGGEGHWQGGDGVIREFEFLAPLAGTMLANRRTTAAFGLAGGGSGAPGRNYLINRAGDVIEYGASAEIEFSPGDRFVIETPGGGGYGSRQRAQ